MALPSKKTLKSAAPDRSRLKERYQKEIIPSLMKEFSYKNPMQVPRLSKVVLNVGMGEAITNIKLLDAAANELALLTGQHPVMTKAKKSIAGFKLREGTPIGCKVTLRGERMYEFLDRLLSVALPRIRDFRGVSTKGFDGSGNFTIGIKEQLIFPELKYDEIVAIHGMDITIVTTAGSNEEGRSLLRYFGMPFRTDGPRG
jgi:large subunit ribosomal protein L5